MGQERGRPELLIDESVALGFALTGDAIGSPAHRVGRHSGLDRAEVTKLDEALLAHRGQVAGDSAVVADELALLGLGILQVGGVDESSRDFPAGERELVAQSLAILANEKAVLEADVDMVPG